MPHEISLTVSRKFEGSKLQLATATSSTVVSITFQGSTLFKQALPECPFPRAERIRLHPA